ncbi:MAG: efflux RND transporter periplasmic adaptor subunit, partial [Bacteroidales bacterium]|nr:efflux RND transporter periplasmic adaptor subunit [Bacteroidales bacterium]
LSNVVKAFGEITLPPTGEATVSPFIGGVITDISVIEGDYVEKGRKIARIEHPDIVELQRDYLEAKNNSEYLEAEYRRQKQLYQDSVNAAKTVQKVKSEYQTNRAQLQSLKKKLELIHLNPENLTSESLQKGYPVRAPISGYVSSISVSTGDNVSQQQQLFHITDNKKAHIDLEIYEKDIDNVKKGQRLTFNLANNPLPGPMKGSILKKSQRFNRDSRTALVHADIDKIKTTLLPGMSVTAHIQTGGKQQFALPTSAIISDQGKDYVFKLQRSVAKESGHEHEEHQHENEEAHHDHEPTGKYFIFKKVKISKGMSEAGFTGVNFKESVDDKTRFVIDNPQAVLSEMKSGGDGHGHAH